MASRKWGLEDDRVEINPALRGDARLSGSRGKDKQLPRFATDCRGIIFVFFFGWITIPIIWLCKISKLNQFDVDKNSANIVNTQKASVLLVDH